MAKGTRRIPWALSCLGAAIFLGLLASKLLRNDTKQATPPPAGEIQAPEGRQNPSPPTQGAESGPSVESLVEKWRQQALEKHPALAIKAHQVPDDQNGFLQLHLLGQTLKLSDEFMKLLGNVRFANDFDSKTAIKLLKEYKGFVDEVERIAVIPEGSSLKMPDDYEGIIDGHVSAYAIDVMMLKACLAAADGDSKDAFGFMVLAGNLIDQLQKIETPNFYSETIATLEETSRQRVFLTYILPRLGKKTDLQPWLEELNHIERCSTMRLAEVYRGEWHTSSKHMAFPIYAERQLKGLIHDGEAHALAYTEWMAREIALLESGQAYGPIEEIESNKSYKDLDLAKRFMIKSIALGQEEWRKGFYMNSVRVARNLAAIELLMLEQGGETLTIHSPGKVTCDPIARMAFAFDPEKRELQITGNELMKDEEPLKLPW